MGTGTERKMLASGSVAAGELLDVMDPKGLLKGLEGKTRLLARWLLLELAIAGYGKVRVASGRRSLDEQQRIYGQGRDVAACKSVGVPATYSRPDGPVVTWVVPACSRHVRGEAFDLDLSAYGARSYPAIGVIGESCGLDWGGRWDARDDGHFELRA